MKTICIVSTVGAAVDAFMLKHIEYLQGIAEVTLVLGDSATVNSNITIKRIHIDRKINIKNDLKSVYYLYKFFNQNKFDVVLSLMPKSGLLSMVSSCLANIDLRFHIFTGQGWVTKKEPFRLLLKYMDKIIVKYSSSVLIDSNTQKQFLIDENILNQEQGFILNKGSISGVNLNKFKANGKIKNTLIEKYTIPKDEIVFLFLGRINKDKGILDLQDTFLELFKKYSNIKLFIAGPLEDEYLKKDLQNLFENQNVITSLIYCNNPENLINIADVLVLPSYREGFGTIVIEAAAMNIPTIGSNIYGLQDSISDKKTGILHTVANVQDMITKYSELIENRSNIITLGNNAYKRVKEDFNDNVVSKALLDFIKEKIHKIK